MLPPNDLLSAEQKFLLEDYAFASNPDGIVITDSRGIVLWCNAAYLSLSGYAHGEVVGNQLRLYTSIKQDEKFYNRLWASLFEGETFCGNITNQRKDGSFYEKEYTIIPFRTNQITSHFVVTLHDVINPNPVEIKLSTIECQFRSFVQSMSLIGVMFNAGGRITLCNDFLLGLTGWKSEEVLNQNWFDFFVPAENREILKDVIFKRNMATGEILARSETEIMTRQGERRLISWNNTVLREENGAISGVASIGEDITKRRQEEAQSQLQRNALEATANAIMITNRNGVIEWVNPAFTVFTGYSFADVIGRDPSLLKSGKHDAKFYENLWSVISYGNVWHGEVINRRKDGSLYNEEMTITPMLNPKRATLIKPSETTFSQMMPGLHS